jgi:hypothetical protein
MTTRTDIEKIRRDLEKTKSKVERLTAELAQASEARYSILRTKPVLPLSLRPIPIPTAVPKSTVTVTASGEWIRHSPRSDRS